MDRASRSQKLLSHRHFHETDADHRLCMLAADDPEASEPTLRLNCLSGGSPADLVSIIALTKSLLSSDDGLQLSKD